MRVSLHVIVDQEDEAIVEIVKEEINHLCSAFTFSPSRPQPSLRNCLEFYGSATLDSNEIESLLSQLNNDWDGDMDDCCAYGFNTKMFHPNGYYLQFQIL